MAPWRHQRKSVDKNSNCWTPWTSIWNVDHQGFIRHLQDFLFCFEMVYWFQTNLTISHSFYYKCIFLRFQHEWNAWTRLHVCACIFSITCCHIISCPWLEPDFKQIPANWRLIQQFNQLNTQSFLFVVLYFPNEKNSMPLLSLVGIVQNMSNNFARFVHKSPRNTVCRLQIDS